MACRDESVDSVEAHQSAEFRGAHASAYSDGGKAAENGGVVFAHKTADGRGPGSRIDCTSGGTGGNSSGIQSDEAADPISAAAGAYRRRRHAGIDGSVVEPDQTADIAGVCAGSDDGAADRGVTDYSCGVVGACQPADVHIAGHRHASQAEITNGAGVLGKQPDIGGPRQTDGEARDGVPLAVEDAGKGR